MRRFLSGPMGRGLAVCAAVGCTILFGLANWHLFAAAERSQPGCVEHSRPGTAPAGGTSGFAAARSSCTPH